MKDSPNESLHYMLWPLLDDFDDQSVFFICTPLKYSLGCL